MKKKENLKGRIKNINRLSDADPRGARLAHWSNSQSSELAETIRYNMYYICIAKKFHFVYHIKGSSHYPDCMFGTWVRLPRR